MTRYIALGLLGVGVGAVGTLIGAGGGFLLVPFLLLLYPREDAATITSITLAVVFCNALSGSVAYARMKRVDYRSAAWFSLTAIPGAMLGATTTAALARWLFDVTFGTILVFASALLLIAAAPQACADATTTGRTVRTVIERDGTRHTYSYRLARGLGLSGAVGYLSSLLGIGGGVIHVPAMIRWLNFPPHIATATSHFLLAIMALAGTVVHIVTGAFQHGLRRTAALAIGAVAGAQLGARLSTKLPARWIVRGLAAALALVGVRILTHAL